LAEAHVRQARRLREEGRGEDASAAYRKALAIAPDAKGLHVEAAEAELQAGSIENALALAERAVESHPDWGAAYLVQGDALRAAGNWEGAVSAYERAAIQLPASTEIAERLSAARAELDRRRLPQEYFQIPESERVTREQLAALLFVKLRPGIENTGRQRSVIVTDISSSWARDFIRAVTAVGFLDVYPNHTFQPLGFVRKSDLALAFSAVMGEMAPSLVARAAVPPVVDVPPDNLSFSAVSLTVSLGLLPVDDGDRFEPLRFVSGQEAVEAVEALSRKVLSP
jgi:tetratricopeptide (TPR) repeat protein